MRLPSPVRWCGGVGSRTYLWRENDCNDDDGWPYPLQRIGDSPPPFVLSFQESCEYARGDGLSYDPAHVDVCREDGTQRQRAHLGGVGSRQGLYKSAIAAVTTMSPLCVPEMLPTESRKAGKQQTA